MDVSEKKEDMEIVRNTQNGYGVDTMMTNVEEKRDELTNVNNDLPYSNGEGVENELQSPTGTIDAYEEEGSFEPSAITSALISDVPGDRNELHMDRPIQLASVEPSETTLERQAEGENESRSNEIELDQGETNGVAPYPEIERNGETLNMTFEGEETEEKLISDSNGLRDSRSKDKDFENMVTDSDFVMEELDETEIKEELSVDENENEINNSFLLGPGATEDEETGTLEEQVAFVKELEFFHKERSLDFRPPRFYQEPLNLLKLWRAVVRLGGYEQVTSCKLWRQIGESFKPPKTCTTVSWTFRCFYEKALLEYEKHKLRCGELPYTDASFPEHIGATPLVAIGSGRQRRDAAARAMQGWHSQRLLGNGEDKASTSTPKRERPLKSIGLLKRKKPFPVERSLHVHMGSNLQSEADVIDIGHPADWVKINVQRTKDCFEVYALVPGLLREEVRVQSDAAGRLVISGQPEQVDNPWGVTPFKKVVSLPSRIDPHQTSAVVTLHGQLFVRVPFDPLDI